ncbi:MAG TPA: hypothetical protein VKI17_08645, partial [Gemmataceae bacterium]|nr:hypothetical protein [Gemmataceae bacterium]
MECFQRSLCSVHLAARPQAGRGTGPAAQSQIRLTGLVIIVRQHQFKMRRRKEVTPCRFSVARSFRKHGTLNFARFHRYKHVAHQRSGFISRPGSARSFA